MNTMNNIRAAIFDIVTAAEFNAEGAHVKRAISANKTDYVVMSYATRQKKLQGGLTNIEVSFDKSMYATETANYPVEMLRLFLEKTYPNSMWLFLQFNKCVKEAIYKPGEIKYWYKNKAMGEIKLLLLHAGYFKIFELQ